MIVLQIGIAHKLLPGVAYALPAKAVLAASNGAIEVSQDNITFEPIALTNGQVALASMFVRAPNADTIVSLKEADANVLVTNIGEGGGGTAAGDNITIDNADPAITLIDSDANPDLGKWRIASKYESLFLDSMTDAGTSKGHPTYIDHASGGMYTGSISATGGINGTYLQPMETSFSSVNNNPAIQTGGLANINDSTVNTIGATIAGGGINHVLGRFNGSVWKVIGV